MGSAQVARALGITQKSAWFMMHRIRVALQRGGFDKFAGPDSPHATADLEHHVRGSETIR
jgi:hypothetical protein